MDKILFLLMFTLFNSMTAQDKPSDKDHLFQKADEMSRKLLIVDTHIDVPYRLNKGWEDISMPAGGHFDYSRAVKGGLNAAFMSIYIPPRFEQSGGSVELADKLISIVEFFADKYPEKFFIARSYDDIIKNQNSNVIALPMGMENGTPIEGKFENLEYFYKKGIRYITLAHGKANHICDSSYDPDRKWNGLSPFGKSLILEMNRMGMMIDISHVSDSAFYQVIKISKAPVIASHSSCRHFTPGFERNMSDEMIIRLAENGGVIQINFGTDFISGVYREKMAGFYGDLKEKGISRWSEEGKSLFDKFVREYNVDLGSAELIADHIDHVRNIAGIDHVGLGSDFDGIAVLPDGIKDVSSYPNIILELLKKGYSEEEIEKVCSGNILRVWKVVEDYSMKGNNK